MPSEKTKTPVLPDKYYHIYNRGNNHEKVFFQEEDYLLILERYKYFMNSFVDTYAFCLIPNHYHFLIRIKSETEKGSEASNEFRKLFLSYTNKINIKRGRSGSLFLRYFKRVEIQNMNYLKHLVYYIHHNPVKHGLIEDFRTYRYSSYRLLAGSMPTNLKREEVFDWFGSKQEFIEYHDFKHSEEEIKRIIID